MDGVVHEDLEIALRKTMYIEFALRAKNHVKRVQEALFSIENALKKIDSDDNDYVNIIRAELIRRALIHDNDKCEDDHMIEGKKVPRHFAECTVWCDSFFGQGGADLEYGSEAYRKLHSEAGKGLDILLGHKGMNDHHPEYYEKPNDMRFIQLIEMVCDWWGATAYSNDNPLDRFLESCDVNVCKYKFNSYQQFVIEKTRDFIAKDETHLIKIIFNGCVNYDKGSIKASTSVSDFEVQFYKQLNDFLKDRIALLNEAEARRNSRYERPNHQQTGSH